MKGKEKVMTHRTPIAASAFAALVAGVGHPPLAVEIALAAILGVDRTD